MKVKEMEQRVGGLSKPSKMPGFAYGIPAWECKIGSFLRKVKNSVCSKCYALKGMYVFPVVRAAQETRFKKIHGPNWVIDMTTLIQFKYRKKKTKKDRIFRWHDAGDIQSVAHLEKIVEIANSLPTMRFWLPTREKQILRDFLATGQEFPANLIVRVSAAMIGQSQDDNIPGTVSSTVGVGKGFQCKAPKQKGKCLNCRACWDNSVKVVDYSQH